MTKKIKKLIQQEEGQALVMIVLVMLVALTVGVAVSSQTLISSRQAVSDENSAQAYAAAESGAEIALKTLKSCSGSDCYDPGSGSVGDAGYEYTVDAHGLITTDVYETKLGQDDVIQIDLTRDSAGAPLNNTDVQIYWWSTDHPEGGDTGDLAALEFTYIVEDAGTYVVSAKEAYDGDVVRVSSNDFSTPQGGNIISGRTYDYLASTAAVSFTTATETARILRIRSWYNNTWVAVRLGNSKNFSNQGFEITSTGISGENERTIRVTRSNPYLPGIFDFVLYSGGDLTK